MWGAEGVVGGVYILTLEGGAYRLGEGLLGVMVQQGLLTFKVWWEMFDGANFYQTCCNLEMLQVNLPLCSLC